MATCELFVQSLCQQSVGLVIAVLCRENVNKRCRRNYCDEWRYHNATYSLDLLLLLMRKKETMCVSEFTVNWQKDKSPNRCSLCSNIKPTFYVLPYGLTGLEARGN